MGRIKTTKSSFSITNDKGTMTQQPRSFLDVLTGTSKVSYTRPSKPMPTQKSVNKAFRSYGPTSNGKGVGGL